MNLSPRLVCDLELLLDGSFYPLTGFLCKADYESVLNKMRLSDGSLWPIPIVLPIPANHFERYANCKSIILKNSYNLPIAKLYVKDIYKPDIDRECRQVFGTNDINHPYVKIMHEWKKKNVWYVGGKVERINSVPHFDFCDLRNNPSQIKAFYKQNGWTCIIGFQTRNPMHRSHYELTKYALNIVNNSKLLIQPIVGVTQECDINYHARVKCYRLILNYYQKNTAKLTILPLSMRMAGPREAMWHALIRKNYGCTHFIVGRGHAEPSFKDKNNKPFYGPYDAHELLSKFKNELGIKIVKSKMIVYVEELKDYIPIDKLKSNMTPLRISGTQQRKMLKLGQPIPEWFSYPEIIAELRKTIVPKHMRGFCIYFIGLSGSGKTTLANTLKYKLQELIYRPITILDGDIIRQNLSKGLGFNKKDRSINVKRIGFVASEIVKHRGIVLCANIAPYEHDRIHNRELISHCGGYIEVFIDTPLSVCEKRDTKGLYKLARQGKIKEFTGISDPFEEPKHSDIIITDMNLNNNIELIINKLRKLGYIRD